MKYILRVLLALALLLSIQPALFASSGQETDARFELNVLRSDERGVLLELYTPGYRFETFEDAGSQYDMLRIAGASYTAQPGAPQVPQVNALIGVPPEVELSIIIHSDKATPLAGSYILPPAPQAAALEGDFQPGELEYAIDQSLYASGQLYPQVSAHLGEDAWLRDQRIARIELFPFQYLPTQGRLYWRQRILVEVAFEYPSGMEQDQQLLINPQQKSSDPYAALLKKSLVNADMAERWRGFPRQTTPDSPSIVASQLVAAPAYRIPLTEDGLYRLTYQNLQAAGLDVSQINPHNLHLTSQGQDVAMYFDGDGDSSFEAGEYLVFYGEKFYGERLAELHQAEDDHWLSFISQDISGTYTTWQPQMNAIMMEKYTDENVYWLTLEGMPGLRMATVNGLPGTAPVPETYRTSVRVEQSKYWRTWTFATEDSWFWDWINSGFPATRAYTTTLTAVAAGDFSARLRGEIVAFAQNASATPDHHTVLYLNDPAHTQPVDERYWDGKSSYIFDSPIPQSSLLEGVNTLSLVAHLTPQMTAESLYFNWFEIEYQRQFMALDNQITFTPDHSGTWKYQISNINDNEFGVLDITHTVTPTWVTNALMNAGTLSFQVEHGDNTRIHAGAFIDVQPSQITYYDPADLSQTADYLVISHANFMDAAQRLVDYRQSQGLTAKVVDIQELYNQYNFGIFNPLAIKNYLRYTFEQWSDPPSYVVLVGDGTWNFKAYTGFNDLPIYMPPHLSWVDPWQGEVDSANLLAAVVGDDLLPDVFISRIPVNSAAEMDAVVDKIIAYEAAAPQVWQRNLLFIADNADQAGDFAALADSFIADYLEPGFTAQRIYERDYGCMPNTLCPEVNHEITSTLNGPGALIVNFLGHASFRRWTGEQIFINDDIATLENGSKLPIVLSMTCLDGYWIYPGATSSSGQSLIEEMLRTEDKGMVASFSPTGLGVASGHDELQRGFYNSIFADGNWLLGQAAQQAKLRLYSSGSNFDLIHTFTIFGDPALRILSPYSLEFSLDESNDSGPPGGTVEYTFQVTNTSAIADTIAFELEGNAWQVSLPPASTLEKDESAMLSLTVTIPPDAVDGQSDAFTVRAVSQGDVSQVAQAQVTTTAYDYGVRLSVDQDTKNTRAGELVTYNLEVLNNGVYEDGFDLAYSGNQWAVSVSSQTTGNLQPGESAAVTLQVQVPPDAPLGAADAVTITATSQGKPLRSDSVTLTTRIPLHRLYLPDIEK